MSCCVCLAETLNILEVFGQEDPEVNINEVIRKFMWIVVSSVCENVQNKFHLALILNELFYYSTI